MGNFQWVRIFFFFSKRKKGGGAYGGGKGEVYGIWGNFSKKNQSGGGIPRYRWGDGSRLLGETGGGPINNFLAVGFFFSHKGKFSGGKKFIGPVDKKKNTFFGAFSRKGGEKKKIFSPNVFFKKTLFYRFLGGKGCYCLLELKEKRTSGFKKFQKGTFLGAFCLLGGSKKPIVGGFFRGAEKAPPPKKKPLKFF